MEKIFIDWDGFEELAGDIAERYREEGIELIVGLTRGGLPLAVKLSHTLNIPMKTLTWQTRDGSEMDKRMLHDLANRSSLKVLFVDDICDSGKTISGIRKILPFARFTVLFSKKHMVDYCPTRIDSRLPWIVFPWENNN